MKYNNTHTVYINRNNVEVPSATTILKILNKPALLKWANYLGFKHENIKDVLNKASANGTLVHQMVYSYLMNKYFIFIKSHFCNKDELKRYMNSFLNWKNTHDINPIFAEKQLVSNTFGGTIDFYGDVDGKKSIIDFKTSKAIYSSMFLQLAAYCILLEEHGYVVEQVGIILINNTKYTEKFISRNELDMYIESFKLIMEVFHSWFDLNEKYWNTNILN